MAALQSDALCHCTQTSIPHASLALNDTMLHHRPSPNNPHPFVSHLLRSTATEWQSYVKHPFVLQLGRGTLDPDAFRHYIIQDWHYLRNCT